MIKVNNYTLDKKGKVLKKLRSDLLCIKQGNYYQQLSLHQHLF